MRRGPLLALALTLAVVGTALAGSYTITTTAAQDARLDRARLIANSRQLPGAPYATVNAFVDGQCRDHMRELILELADAQDDADFEAAWDAASGVTKNSVCTTLGLAAGCKP